MIAEYKLGSDYVWRDGEAEENNWRKSVKLTLFSIYLNSSDISEDRVVIEGPLVCPPC